MRFRKGTRVEVFSIKEAPYGAWRSAEIISGNGHTYSVRYYAFGLSNGEALEERVPRKIIRPCPPRIDVDRWEAGELVEVLDDISWKTATVLEELPGRYYVVRLLGAAAELTVHKVNLRARQSWQDDRWVLIGNVSCSVKSSTLTGSDVHQNLKPQETSVVSLRLVKRHSPCDWAESAESCTRSPKKMRSMEEEEHQSRFASSSVQKLDAFSCCPKRSGGKIGFRRQLVRVRTKRFSEFVVGSGSSVSNGCYDTDASSVGSCSPISYDESDMLTSSLDGSSSQVADNACSSDAESSKEAFSCREEGAVRSSRSELYTYRSTLWKLFASGPLSWDQEASLTDLRLCLNISTDEHLMELRNLKSAGTYSTFC
uniref:ENT domain-containing protein n=1 Tax=Noccaea caerulescens TaxID=107243 RepID=A0A1J3EY40_NOCCA